MRDELIVNPDFLYDQYQTAEFEAPTQQVITGTAITNLNGLTGPNLTFGGGTSGFSFTPAGITITLASPLTTKGDIYTHDATNGSRLAVGSNGQVLTADSAATNGVKWAVAGSATNLPLLASPTLNVNTNTKQTLYTVTTGKSAVIVAVMGRSASVNLSTGATTNLSFGFNAGANDWANATFAITQLTSSTRILYLSQEVAMGGASSVLGTSTQVFGAITDAAFGSAATVVIDLFGYEF